MGANTLEIVSRHPEKFRVAALAGGRNLDRMAEQILRFRPEIASVLEEEEARTLRERVKSAPTRVLSGQDGVMAVATHPEAVMVVSALVGSAGLLPTLAAVKAGKNIALANKECLVMAGEILTREVRQRGVALLPVDSEHSAVFQSLAGNRREEIKRIILTASGGPFLHTSMEDLKKVTPEQALKHPQWNMGRKVTIDSASLMNKGLEVIEAYWLFGVPPDRIEVHVHPQSIVHSMIEYIDGSMIAQLALPDMRGPIAYALSYPERLDSRIPSLDLTAAGPLTFAAVDHQRFPARGLAYRALKAEGTMPAVLNGANEVAVQAFLDGRLEFVDIPRLIRETMDRHSPRPQNKLEDVLRADEWARQEARQMIERGKL
ncbi:MAG TPA: 1-deoxy-D-xylulose-5-phosphate reductoisomerase [Thermodesulfobacteriota bacterium]|nr:1-deoxy-D-xylulose-5-phosphate reductoisomerase [Thermodesulfobacteriota bacterium]